MTEEELVPLELEIKPVAQSLNGINALLAQKSRGADSALAAGLAVKKVKVAELRAKLEVASAKLRGQRELIIANKGCDAVKDRIEKAEEAFAKCQEAEMPYLQGVEILPKEQSAKALADAESATRATAQATNQAKSIIKARQAESKRLPEAVAVVINETLAALTTRVEEIEKKLQTFCKDTSERKMLAIIAESSESIDAAEKSVEALVEATKPLVDGDEDVEIDALKDVLNKATEAEKETTAACLAARKVLIAGKAQMKAGDDVQEFDKLVERMKAADATVSEKTNAIATADKTVRVKDIIVQEETRLGEADASIEEAEKAMPVDDETLTEDGLNIMMDAMTSAAAVLKLVLSRVQPLAASAPENLKEGLTDILTRRGEVLEKLDAFKLRSKDAREMILSDVYCREGEEKVAAAEAAVEKTDEAELPFLKGVEVLPLTEAQNAIAESEKVATEAADAIKEAQAYITAKTTECKTFGEDAAEPVTNRFVVLSERATSALQKLTTFNSETAARKISTKLQEAGEMIDGMEADVKETVDAAAPFLAEGAADLSESEAVEPLEKFLAAEKIAKEKVASFRSILVESGRLAKGDAEHANALRQLQVRLAEAGKEMAKVRKAAATHEQRFLAKRILEEANEKLATLDGVCKKPEEVAAPLFEHGAVEHLVTTSVRTLAKALEAHAVEKNLDLAGLFQLLGAGEGKADEAAFIKFLVELPDTIGHEELAFGADRCKAIFKRISADGGVGKDEFVQIFRERVICKAAVSVTDGFVVSDDSKTVGKVEPGEQIELIGLSRTDDDGLTRAECKVKVEDGEVAGWVTKKGATGIIHLISASSFDLFCGEIDKAVVDTANAINGVSAFLTHKVREAPVNARTELAKLRPQVAAFVQELETLKKKLHSAKTQFRNTERQELNAHIVARERKEAEVLTGPALPVVAEFDAAVKAAEDKAQELVSLDDDALRAFADPTSVLEDVEAICEKITEKSEEAREAVSEQIKVVADIKPPTAASREAAKQLSAMFARLATTVIAAKVKTMRDSVCAKCAVLVDSIFMPASAAIREQLRKADKTAESLFEELADGSATISEENFCKKLLSLEGLNIKLEHAKLLCKQHFGSGGLSRRTFLGFVELYYSVVKAIALTDGQNVNTCKTLRKVELEEVLVALEGPLKEGGLTRVRVKSMVDGAEGWVSVKGNAGTPFLQEVEKPYYSVCKELSLDKEFRTTGAIRQLEADEVLELLEGPRKVVHKNVLRGRVKANKDGAAGWVTLKDREGAENAEVPDKTAAKCYSVTREVPIQKKFASSERPEDLVRILEVDETFQLVEGPREEYSLPEVRVKVRALRDGEVGWITRKDDIVRPWTVE